MERIETSGAVPQTIHIHHRPARGAWALRILLALLLISVVLNLTQLSAYRDYRSGSEPPYERFVEGDLGSSDKIAILEIHGAILPPLSDQVMETIDRIEEDHNVRGVLVSIDSPGGLVADSHRIYARLRELREKMPMVVSMGRLAASGGYYVAMAARPEDPIFAEETTWTGSIGVIIPRYDISQLGDKIGVQSDSLKTGELKDALDPFSPLSEEERRVWKIVLDESLDTFVRVINENREDLSEDQIRQYATGQIFTATQALDLKLIDRIGERDDALQALKKQLKLDSARIVTYTHPGGLLESLIGLRVAAASADPVRTLLEASVPRAMYFFGWQGGLTR